MVSGDSNLAGFEKTMKDAYFLAVPFDDKKTSSAIMEKYESNAWPYAVLFNGKTGDVSKMKFYIRSKFLNYLKLNLKTYLIALLII